MIYINFVLNIFSKTQNYKYYNQNKKDIMMNMPYEVILERIKEKSELSEAEIIQKIDKKLDQLSGLISKEGAAHILANELGIKIFEVPKISK